ncbi:MAG: hypothetical protein AAF389_00600 [Gemmatimonadota bacterium]
MKAIRLLGIMAVGGLGAGWFLSSPNEDVGAAAPGMSSESTVSSQAATSPTDTEVSAGYIYGRVTTSDGAYEGRLRWGGDEEVLWTHQFNGRVVQNRWIEHVPSGVGPKSGFSVLGVRLFGGTSSEALERPFMARFGDILRLEPRGREIHVTLKSGVVVVLDRFESDDLADGVRVEDRRRGTVDVDEWSIESIDFLATPAETGLPAALHGTIETASGTFTGLIQWDRTQALETDVLSGEESGSERSVPFSAVRSLRPSGEELEITLRSGEQVVLAGERGFGEGSRGAYVDDARFGRVLVGWDVMERVTFSAGGAAPAFETFEPGASLEGEILTTWGDRYTGRIVFDLDEAETTSTLDAPANGIDYLMPFSLVSAIDLANEEVAEVALSTGVSVELDRAGDLGPHNGGVLVFGDSGTVDYIGWADVARIVFDARSDNSSW